MILCLGPTPAVQRVMVLQSLRIGDVNRAALTLEGAAGKSVNVAKVLSALGSRPVALGFLGGARGEFIRSCLDRTGVESDFVQVPEPSRLCVTVIDESGGTVTEMVEESRAVAAEHYDELLARTRRWAAGSRAVVMSGTLPPGGPRDLYRTGCEIAHAAGSLSVVDAKGEVLELALAARPGLVKPNRAELSASLGRELPDTEAVVAGMKELLERGARRVVVTAGGEPVLAAEGGQVWEVSVPSLHTRNPIGSGDAFTAGMVHILTGGGDMAEALRWGAAAGVANALTLMPGEIDVAAVRGLLPQIAMRQIH